MSKEIIRQINEKNPNVEISNVKKINSKCIGGMFYNTCEAEENETKYYISRLENIWFIQSIYKHHYTY